MIITREILDMIEDYWSIAEIEIGDDYILMWVEDPEEVRYALNAVNVEYKKILDEQGFRPYRYYDRGGIRLYIKKER